MKLVNLGRLGFDTKQSRAVSILLKGASNPWFTYVRSCRACPLCTPSRVPTSPSGPLDSFFVFQGRNPGITECEHGIPFHPEAPGGRIFELYCEWLGILRDECYVTNSLFSYKDREVAPDAAEVATCARFKYHEFSLLSHPKFVFLLGNDAFHQWTGVTYSISRDYGKVVWLAETPNGTKSILIPVWHPGSVLRNSELKNEVHGQLTRIAHEFIVPFNSFASVTQDTQQLKQWLPPF